MKRLFVAAILFGLAGCGDTAATPVDASVGGDLTTFSSNCGKPGDVGNTLGVGKFCSGLQDCFGNSQATLCARLGDPNNYFCTFACMANGAAGQCGPGASCSCQGGQCGCTPDACYPPHPG